MISQDLLEHRSAFLRCGVYIGIHGLVSCIWSVDVCLWVSICLLVTICGSVE